MHLRCRSKLKTLKWWTPSPFLLFLCLHKAGPVPQPDPAQLLFPNSHPKLWFIPSNVPMRSGSSHNLTYIMLYHFLSIPFSLSPRIVQKPHNCCPSSSLNSHKLSLHAAMNCQKCKSGYCFPYLNFPVAPHSYGMKSTFLIVAFKGDPSRLVLHTSPASTSITPFFRLTH